MKKLTDYIQQPINEKEDKINLKATNYQGYATLMNVDAVALMLMAEMSLDWLKNPNKSADFYKGDGGQTVTYAKPDIESTCKYILDNYDDVINN